MNLREDLKQLLEDAYEDHFDSKFAASYDYFENVANKISCLFESLIRQREEALLREKEEYARQEVEKAIMDIAKGMQIGILYTGMYGFETKNNVQSRLQELVQTRGINLTENE